MSICYYQLLTMGYYQLLWVTISYYQLLSVAVGKIARSPFSFNTLADSFYNIKNGLPIVTSKVRQKISVMKT